MYVLRLGILCEKLDYLINCMKRIDCKIKKYCIRLLLVLATPSS